MQKYIFVNGLMKLNPEYKKQSGNSQTTVARPDTSLAVVSSTQDIMDANHASNGKVIVSDATVNSMEIMQDEGFLESYQTGQKLDGGEILDKLTNIFAKYEVPIGVVNKLLGLLQYKLNFIIDDSGSMLAKTDSQVSQAGEYMSKLLRNRHPKEWMTRWEEAEDRLHVMIDILSYIPTGQITIGFLNRNNKIILDRKGKSLEQFANEGHAKIRQAFAAEKPMYRTPIMTKLREAFNNCSGNTMHYLFTDGVPTDASTKAVADLVLRRRNPQNNPLTFISCTNQDDETTWMKEIEEIAPYTAELDDFSDERDEVLNDQGPAFPYTKGLWLVSQLVAAINPDDLDAIDEAAPFTKFTLDNLMGRKLTSEEYKHYWMNHPQAQYKFQQYYNRFLNEQTVAKNIINGSYPPPPPYYGNNTYNNQPNYGSNYGNSYNQNQSNYGYNSSGYNQSNSSTQNTFYQYNNHPQNNNFPTAPQNNNFMANDSGNNNLYPSAPPKPNKY